MIDQERDTIMSIWDDKALRAKLEYDPYSLTQDELRQLESVDRLNEKLQQCKKPYDSNTNVHHYTND